MRRFGRCKWWRLTAAAAGRKKKKKSARGEDRLSRWPFCH
jgi:hypothetical protein